MKGYRYAALTVLAVLAVLLTIAVGGLGEQRPSCTVFVQPGESIQAAIDAAEEGAVICLAAGEWEEHLIIGKSLTLRGEDGTTIRGGWFPLLIRLFLALTLRGEDGTTIRGYRDDVPVIRVHTPGEAEVVVVIDGLTVTGGRGWRGPGLRIEGNAQTTITNSTIEGNRAGIRMGDSAQTTIEGSTIEGNWYGIRLEDLAQAEITNSSISKNQGDGIIMEDWTQATFTDCTISGNGAGAGRRITAGISLVDFSGQVTLTGCTISGNEDDGILIGPPLIGGSPQVKITDSDISNNGGGIISLGLGTSAQITITGSTISGNRSSGIVLQDSSRIEIINSTISGNDGDGIFLAWSAQAAITDDSTISGNARFGIRLEGWGLVETTRSTISENGYAGILLRFSARAAIIGNKIINNGEYGVALFQQPCYDTDAVFSGHVVGRANTIPGPDELDGNRKGAVCPSPELDFLMTEEGGEHP